MSSAHCEVKLCKKKKKKEKEKEKKKRKKKTLKAYVMGKIKYAFL